MRTADLDFHLPDDLLATTAAEPRDAARLMVCHRATGQVTHHRVADLPDLGLFAPGDLLVMNRSKVVPARFSATRTATGGTVTGLYLAHTGDRWQVMLQSGGRLQPGETLHLSGTSHLHLLEATGGGTWSARLLGPTPTVELLETIGHPPLPPYIRKARQHRHEPENQPTDPTRYNTVYAREPGSVAAPTAGLHLTTTLLDRLASQGVEQAQVILHVGLGTFAPVRTEQIEDHRIHRESVTVPAATTAALHRTRSAGGRILAVGTTTVRAIESLPAHHLPGSAHTGCTDLFITPDLVAAGAFTWRHTDRLLTNFHLPRSTLLAMVAALPGVGLKRLLHWYAQAIDHRYRFYSYGDAMLIV